MITQVCIASTTKLSQIFKTTFEEFRWIEENYRGYNLENIVTRRVYHSHITMDTGRVSQYWRRLGEVQVVPFYADLQNPTTYYRTMCDVRRSIASRTKREDP